MTGQYSKSGSLYQLLHRCPYTGLETGYFSWLFEDDSVSTKCDNKTADSGQFYPRTEGVTSFYQREMT